MNHQAAQDEFLDLIDGRIDNGRKEALLDHLSQCESCKEAFEDYRRTVLLQSRLASEQYTLEQGFGGAVMELIERESAQQADRLGREEACGSRQRRVWRNAVRVGASVGTALIVLVVIQTSFSGRGQDNSYNPSYSSNGGSSSYFNPSFSGSEEYSTATFSEAAYDDSLVRNTVGNLFKLIEGAFGALVMVVCFFAAIITLFLPLKSKRRVLACGTLMSAACAMFCLRATVGLFFGDNYSDYSDASSGGGSGGGDGGGPTGSYSEAAYDDSLIRPNPFSSWFSGRKDSSESVGRAEHGSYNEPQPHQPSPSDLANERYAPIYSTGWQSTQDAPVSTFAIDVDTGSYTNVRRLLRNGTLPPPDAVRIEELVNYFSYRYPAPESGPFAVSLELAPSPIRAGNEPSHLLRVGIRAKDAPSREDRGWNLVFLIDVSGSMATEDKLPLLKSSLSKLVEKLRPEDRIAIVTYAASSKIVLESTSGSEKIKILRTISGLAAGGSTNGEAGIQTAYSIVSANKIAGGVNRVIMATDGDFNVGLSSFSEVIELIERQRAEGISFSTLGFGTGDLKEDNLEQLADRGNGSYFYIDSLQEADRIFSRKLASTIEDVAKDVKIQLELNPSVVESYHLIGFENRTLAEPHFTDDSVDGGEIGSGHTMTALYELKLKGSNEVESNHPGELGYLKLRYKDLTGSNSSQMELPISTAMIEDTAETSDDYRFAAAVAAFGTLLREDASLYFYSMDDVKRLAETSSSFDPDGERKEFIQLIEKAIAIRQKNGRDGRRYQ